jgi:UDP-glucose 4-epimerase
MVKKIIILGASGFIGNWLLKRFRSNKHYKIVGYSSRDCDLLSWESIKEVLSSVKSDDIIIMTSCITSNKENSFDTMIKNTLMVKNISKFIEQQSISYFIFLSTVDIYGAVKSDTIITEELLPQPFNYYSISKLSSESILKKVCFKNKIPLLILRMPGIYGPGDDDISLINKFVKSALTKKKVTLIGNGKDKRDLVYVDDIYKIIKSSIKNKPNILLNIATGKSYNINQIIEFIRSDYLVDFLVEYKQKEKGAQIYDLVYDVSLLNKFFPNFNPVNLKKGINLYIKYYKSKKRDLIL